MSLFGAVWRADRRFIWTVLQHPEKNPFFGSVNPGRSYLSTRDQIARAQFPVFKILFPKIHEYNKNAF